jgi:hypothetical protein
MNKYEKWYTSITENAKNRVIIGYTERHHIIPRSLDGTDEKYNLVDLTAREHFICHWLLTKMYTGEARSKMIYALNGMKRTNKEQERYETPITSRVYAQLKEEFGKTHSATMKGRVPPNKGKPMSEEQKAKIRATKKANPRIITEEYREQQRQGRLGKTHSNNTKQKMSTSAKGKSKGPMSDEGKQKRSDALKGKPKSAETTAKKAETLRRLAAEGKHHSMIKVTCPHCTKEVTKLVYGRLHGTQCKSLLLT